MAKVQGEKMVITIDVKKGDIISIKNEHDDPAEDVTLDDLVEELAQGKKKKLKTEPCVIFHTNPCVYYLQRGVLRRVCW